MVSYFMDCLQALRGCLQCALNIGQCCPSIDMHCRILKGTSTVVTGSGDMFAGAEGAEDAADGAARQPWSSFDWSRSGSAGAQLQNMGERVRSLFTRGGQPAAARAQPPGAAAVASAGPGTPDEEVHTHHFGQWGHTLPAAPGAPSFACMRPACSQSITIAAWSLYLLYLLGLVPSHLDTSVCFCVANNRQP